MARAGDGIARAPFFIFSFFHFSRSQPGPAHSFGGRLVGPTVYFAYDVERMGEDEAVLHIEPDLDGSRGVVRSHALF